MRKNHGSKLKSIAVVMTMVLAAFTAGIIMFGSISAQPNNFSITGPADYSIVQAGSTVTITWDNASLSDLNVGYNISINGTVIASNITGLVYTYNWDTTGYGTGLRTIGVSAFNWTSGEDHVTVKSDNNMSIYLRETPGLTAWQGGNGTIDNQVLKETIDTENLKYGANLDILINKTAGWIAGQTYYLYHPMYNGHKGGGYGYNLTWRKYTAASGPDPSFTSADSTPKFSNITLNVSGLWIIDNAGTTDANLNSYNQFIKTVPAWFWVNGTTTLTITDIADFEYNSSGTFDFTVSSSSIMDIMYDWNGSQVIGSGDRWQSDGVLSVNKNSSYFTAAGNYTAFAYRDADNTNKSSSEDDHYYLETNVGSSSHYNYTYGAGAGLTARDTWLATATKYNWSLCGPWDPPEYNATPNQFKVEPAVPIITLTNSTVDYSFTDRIDINVTDGSNGAVQGLNVTVLNETGQWPWVYFGADTGAKGSSVTANWTKGNVGTWTIVVAKSLTGDTTEEWNGSALFTVTSAPGLQIRIIDDGDGDNDKMIEAGPPGISGAFAGVYNITFQVINSTHAAYGNNTYASSSEAEAMPNITISGDACLLSNKTLKELNDIGDGIVSFNTATEAWTVRVIPKMDTLANGGGQITISANWANHGGQADPVTITLGGSSYNGSLVSISPTQITIDQNISVSVTVTTPKYPTHGIMNADVRLYYINDSGCVATEAMINKSTSTDDTGGVYTFHFNRTQQTTNQTLVNDWAGGVFKANRYIVAYADIGNNKYGYAAAKIVPNHNLKATCEAKDSGGASTSTLMSGRDYDYMYFNASVVDSDGNVTGYPTVAAGQNQLYFRLYNESGTDVTDTIISSFTSANLNVTTGANHSLSAGAGNHYIVTPGTYTVYAWNNTYDSTGNNATLEVKQVEVDLTKINDEDVNSAFIWKYDNNISATFEVTYEGEYLNGSLRMDNVTDAGAYNKTWAKCNFSVVTEADLPGENTSLELTKIKGFVNGMVTVQNITANSLAMNLAQQNITFFYKSDKTGSHYGPAIGLVPVRIPDVAASPASIPYNKPTELTITVSGRGDLLEGVFVSIVVPGLTGERNTSTIADGTATFAFTPPTTGDILIKIENRTSETKVPVTSWSLYLDIASSANEDSTFVATVRNGSITGDPVAGAVITFDKKTFTTSSDGTATVDTPEDIPASIDYPITAAKEGYAQASDTIKIINIPKLAVTISGKADGEGYYPSPVTIIVSDDAGNLITGATVTFDTQTDTTINGQVSFSLSGDKKEITITATMPGFKTGEKTIKVKAAGIPGFELLTLVAALGVALILLRRRRH